MALLIPVSLGPAAGAAGRSRRAVPARLPLAAAAALLLALSACESGGGNGNGAEESAAEPTAAGAAESAAADMAAAVTQDESAAAPPGSGIATNRPFVVILFPDGSVDYETELRATMRRAQERKPGFALDMAAVAPSVGTIEELNDNARQALARADQVMQSLGTMGIGRDRINLVTYSSPDTDVTEIRLYIR
ncbi:MAG TPA: hypothetical protein VH835_00940 [Dongiaceae bacterium]|jgi:hypothetical protein